MFEARRHTIRLVFAALMSVTGALPLRPADASDTVVPSKRALIIHSDDAGMSHSVNQATIHAMESGFVTSCSIMVPCPWFPEFAEWASRHPDKDFGIHLTLNSEFGKYRWGPVAGKDAVPTLVDAEGYLPHSKEEIVSRASAAEVELELRAQIDKALKAGIRLSHLDTHMGTVIARGDLLELYVRLGMDYRLPVMIMRHPDPAVSAGYPDLVRNHQSYIRMLEEHGLPAIDYLFQFYEGKDHDARQQRYLKTFRELQPGVTQIIIHCGYDNDELQGITGSHFLRGDDTRIFSDADVKQQIESMGIELINWTQLTERLKNDRR